MPGEAKHMFRGQLSDHFSGLSVDDPKNRPLGFTIEGEGEFLVLAEDLGSVERANCLNDFPMFSTIRRLRGSTRRRQSSYLI
jgi:hypothetical protein